VQRHPWVFSGAIERVDGDPAAGATVDVVDAAGAFLARAAYSPLSQIRARAWSFDSTQALDASFFANAIARACAARQPLLDPAHTACRLVHGESDQLPGVIADRYGDTIVVQLLSAGADTWREAIADALVAATGARCVYERSDAEVRLLEGLSPRVGVLRGTLPEIVDIVEAGIRYRVDVVGGQKTGFYLDQRDNRAIVGAHARGRRVMNAFCYTGGFTLAALAGGAASVRSIDSSTDALRGARANLALNPALDARRAEWSEADVFSELRELRNRGAAFDLIVLDPPKFAPTAAHAQRAARAYKDINCSRRSRARAVSTRRCSRRSSPARHSTPRRMPRSSGGSAPAPTIRWRWRFPKAITSRDFSSARRSAGRARSARRAHRRCGRPKNKAATGAAL